MWTPYGVLLGDPVHVVQMEQLESNWTPHGLHMDSGQKIGWATTQKKMSKVHMDSTWNLWGRVKSSQVVAWRIIIPPQPISSFTQHAATLYKTKDNDSTSLLADGDGATGIAKFQECPIVFKSSSSTIRIHVLWLVFFQPGIAGAVAINS